MTTIQNLYDRLLEAKSRWGIDNDRAQESLRLMEAAENRLADALSGVGKPVLATRGMTSVDHGRRFTEHVMLTAGGMSPRRFVNVTLLSSADAAAKDGGQASN